MLRVMYYVDGEETLLKAGMAVFLPRGVPHTFKVVSPAARYFTFGLPGGMNQLRDATGRRRSLFRSNRPAHAQAREACERLAIEVVGPPAGLARSYPVGART
jgi:hypothetical protein